MKATRFLTLLAGAIFGAALSLSNAAVVYQDDFDFTGAMNGRAPTVAPSAGLTWTTSTTWKGNGTSITAESAVKAAYLPFTPENGYIYELSVKMANTFNSASTVWTSVGFGVASPLVTSNFTTATDGGGFGTLILRENGNYQGYSTRATSAVTGTATPGYASGVFIDFKVVLDTSSSTWVTRYFVGGTQVGTYNWTAGNPPIGSIMLTTTSASPSARFDDFLFTSQAVPEVSSSALCGLAGVLLLSRRRRA